MGKKEMGTKESCQRPSKNPKSDMDRLFVAEKTDMSASCSYATILPVIVGDSMLP